MDEELAGMGFDSGSVDVQSSLRSSYHKMLNS